MREFSHLVDHKKGILEKLLEEMFRLFDIVSSELSMGKLQEIIKTVKTELKEENKKE